MSVAVLGRDWDMIPSSSSHDSQAQQQQQQQEKKASQLFAQRAMQERRLKPPDQVIACPRCQSLNTKFCYYNNYSLTQPRHFCKSCRRYWTAGGTLRNVPVGGGCRKNKRTKPRTPDGSNSGAGSADGESLSVPGFQHAGFSTTSVGFLSSSEGSPYGLAEPSMRADSSMSQGGERGQLIPFQSSGLAPHHSHGFEGGIPAHLNFFRNHPRPETTLNLHPAFQIPTGDLSEIFDTSNAQRVGALTTLNEGLGTFNLNPQAGRDQQPPFASLERWQAAKQQQQQQQQQQPQQPQQQHAAGIRNSEAAQEADMDMNRQDVKGKMTVSMVPVPGMDGPRASAPSWQLPAPQEAQPAAALQHYEQTPPEHNYWGNSAWPSMDSQAFQSSSGSQAL